MFVTPVLAAALALLPSIQGGEAEQAAPAFEIALRPNVQARGLDVTIGELAEVTPVNADSLKIAALRFGPAPAAGYPRTVSRVDVQQSLAASGQALANFRWKGAVEATVQTLTIEITPSMLTEAAQTVLQAVLDQEGGDVEYEVAGTVRSARVQPGHQSQDLRARVRGGATSPSSAVVDVEVLVDGAVGRTVPVQFKLTRFQPVLKLTGTVRAGQPLGPGNVTIAREKLTQVTGLYLSTFAQIEGMIARRNLQPNQLLMLSDVAAPALIRRGELVTVVVTRGRVKVTVRGIANADAALGEMVTVTNAQSRAQITGIAAAAGTVVVPAN